METKPTIKSKKLTESKGQVCTTAGGQILLPVSSASPARYAPSRWPDSFACLFSISSHVCTTAGGQIILPLSTIRASLSGTFWRKAVVNQWLEFSFSLQHVQVGCYTLQQMAIFSCLSSASPGRVLHTTAGGHILLPLFNTSRSGVTHYSRWPDLLASATSASPPYPTQV